MMKLETQLKRLKDPIKNCKICFKPIKISTFRHLFFKNTEICNDCYKEFNPRFIHFSLLDVNALAIYEYDQTIKDKLFRFKGCYDYELKGVFFDYIKEFLSIQYKGYILLPAPSTKTDDEKRGFNHVEEMYSCLKLPIKKGFEKVIDFKQSDLNKEERKDVKNKLKVVD